MPAVPEQAAGARGRAGRAGDKGPHSSLQYTHTVQYHSNDGRPEGQHGRTHTHEVPHARRIPGRLGTRLGHASP